MSELLQSRSPATGEALGSVPAASTEDVRAAAAWARRAQPLWANVPARARSRYLRRAAQAVLDELEPLAALLAHETGRPRTEALLAELLPAVGGLHALADDGPAALADERLGRRAPLRAGRRAALLHAPVGVVGIRGGPASAWAEPALEVAAALLAGDAVVLAPSAPLVGERLHAAFVRAGVPAELLAIVHGETAAAALDAACDRVTDLARPQPKGTMLVLAGAPMDAVVSGALWAAFAGAGRYPAAVGRLVVVASVAEPLLARLEAGARRLRVGDPAHPEAEVGPLASAALRDEVQALVEEAERGGAMRLCGGPMSVPGLRGAFYAPALLRCVAPDARLLREPPPGPVLAVVEAADEAAAIALAADAPPAAPVSVWAGDTAHGERVGRGLPAELVWVNEHGVAAPAAPVRLSRYVTPRQLATQPARLRSARWLPYDPSLVRASTAAARVLHGRESERFAALREGALPLARTALRLAREAARR